MPTQTINLNDTLPAAPANSRNVHWESDPPSLDLTVIRDASASLPLADAAGMGLVPALPGDAAKFFDGTGAFSKPPDATQAGVQDQSYIYAADTGAANAYAVTLSPAPMLVAGSIVVFKATNGNTGASTLAVNGGSAIAIKKSVAADLSSGDIAAGQIVSVVYDGTNFQLIAGAGSSGMTNPMTTQGDLIVGGASGAPGRLAAGTSGDVLTSNGAGSAPSWQAGAGGGGVYFGQDYATATAGNNYIALGSAPLDGSISVYISGAILRAAADWSVTGSNITLTTALSGGEAVMVTWATRNAIPGGIVLSTFAAYPALRGTNIAAGNIETITLPAHCEAGDLAIIFVGVQDSTSIIPTGWAKLYSGGGLYVAGYVFSYVLESADITAGQLSTGHVDNCVIGLAVFNGATGGVRETDANTVGGTFTSPITAPATSSGVTSTDVALFFTMNRSDSAASTDTCSLGTEAQTVSTNPNSGCLYTLQVPAIGSLTPVFSYDQTGHGYFVATVIVKS